MKFLLRTSNIKFWLYNWFNKRASWYRQLWIQSANFRIIQYVAHILFSTDIIRSFYSLLTHRISNGLFFFDVIYCVNLILQRNLPIYLHIISKPKILFKKMTFFLFLFQLLTRVSLAHINVLGIIMIYSYTFLIALLIFFSHEVEQFLTIA